MTYFVLDNGDEFVKSPLYQKSVRRLPAPSKALEAGKPSFRPMFAKLTQDGIAVFEVEVQLLLHLPGIAAEIGEAVATGTEAGDIHILAATERRQHGILTRRVAVPSDPRPHVRSSVQCQIAIGKDWHGPLTLYFPDDVLIREGKYRSITDIVGTQCVYLFQIMKRPINRER